MHKLPVLAVGLNLLFIFTSDASVPLIENGKAKAQIYVSKMAMGENSSPVKSAVDDLNYHFEKMSGAHLPVVAVDSLNEIRRPAIILGDLAIKAGAVPKNTKGKNSIRLLSKDNAVLIAGETAQGTADGIYTLLHRLGCEWVLPGAIGEVIPKQSTVSVPALDLNETPSFQYRYLWYRGGASLNTEKDTLEFDQWKRRQRMNVNTRDALTEFGFGHVWGSFIKKHKAEFDKDPTMLALVRDANGNYVRKGPQLESTHPRVVELFVQDIKDAFEKNKWPKDHKAAFGIGPADGDGYSVSPEWQAAGSGRIDPMLGIPDTTDHLVLLGNEILKKIGVEYPNVTLGFYSYNTHEDYPMRYKPDPRLNIIFAPINGSRYHGIGDANSKTWRYYRNVVELWGRLNREQGNRLVYRGYNWNLAENLAPFSKLRIVGEEMPWYKQNGIEAVVIEATKAWAVNGPHDFLLAKLMWDADLDWKAVTKEYCEKSFGRGAPAMEKYLLDLTERQHGAGQEAGSYHALPLIYDQAFIDAGKKLINGAIAAAQMPEEKTRAGFFLYPLEELELYLQFRDAAGKFDFPAVSSLYKQLNAAWQKAYDTNSQIVAREVPEYLKRFLEKFAGEGLKYSSAPYAIAYPIPERLPVMLDPNNVGEQLNFQSPAINDKDFIQLATWSSTWDAQGLGAYRSGSIWYRVAFERGDNQPLALFLGGVEDEAQVWLNGKYVGKKRGFSMPYVFDLTDAVQKGRNLLAIKIVRNTYVNEIGLGGILRPAFLFTGPRLETTETEAPRRRVLPGGELGEVD